MIEEEGIYPKLGVCIPVGACGDAGDDHNTRQSIQYKAHLYITVHAYNTDPICTTQECDALVQSSSFFFLSKTSIAGNDRMRYMLKIVENDRMRYILTPSGAGDKAIHTKMLLHRQTL